LDLDNISYRKLIEIGFEKLAVWPAIIVSGTYLERFKPAGTKSKETPGEENPEIKRPFDVNTDSRDSRLYRSLLFMIDIKKIADDYNSLNF